MPANTTRFTAGLPWTGPRIAWGSDPRGARILVRGAVDPAFGEASAAAFVPVVRDLASGHFVPADANGSPSTVEKVCKPREVRSDRHGWFQLEADAGWWTNVEGVLVALLYSASPDLGDWSWLEFLDLQGASAFGAKRKLRPEIEQAIHAALAEFLERHGIPDLEPGLVEIGGAQ